MAARFDRTASPVLTLLGETYQPSRGKSGNMAWPRIDELVRLMDRGVPGYEPSLLDNIATVHDECWDALPHGAKHSIREISRHVGLFKYMYANHGFRDATMG